MHEIKFNKIPENIDVKESVEISKKKLSKPYNFEFKLLNIFLQLFYFTKIQRIIRLR